MKVRNPTKVILNSVEFLTAVMEYLIIHNLIGLPPGNAWKIDAILPPTIEFEVNWSPLPKPANLDVATKESPHRLIETEEA